MTSHLPHLVAAAIANTLPEHLRSLTATGFRDTTRVAAGDPDLWAAIFAQNRGAVLAALGRLEQRLADYRNAIEHDDMTTLRRLLAEAKVSVTRWTSHVTRRQSMLWEIEIFPKDRNPDLDRVRADYDLLTHSARGREVLVAASRGYLVDADLHSEDERVRLADLLTDPLVESSRMDRLNAEHRDHADWRKLTVLPKPGVMDPVAESVVAVARELGLAVRAVRTFRRYQVTDSRPGGRARPARPQGAGQRRGRAGGRRPAAGRPARRRPAVRVPQDRRADPQSRRCRPWKRLSRDGQLALTLDEMRTIRDHFREQGRDPTDVELETLAQTWSEHCSHKTLKGRVECGDRVYDNLLKETIFAATQEVRRQLGADDWCVSVFADNAGIVKFDDSITSVSRSRRTTGRSAIEPYGGANTGLGGVIRDVLGIGLGAKPVCQYRRLLLRPAGHAAGIAAAGRAAPAEGDAGRRRRRPRLRQSHGHPDRQRGRAVRRPLPGQPARLLRHRRRDAGRLRVRSRCGPAT